MPIFRIGSPQISIPRLACAHRGSLRAGRAAPLPARGLLAPEVASCWAQAEAQTRVRTRPATTMRTVNWHCCPRRLCHPLAADHRCVACSPSTRGPRNTAAAHFRRINLRPGPGEARVRVLLGRPRHSLYIQTPALPDTLLYNDERPKLSSAHGGQTLRRTNICNANNIPHANLILRRLSSVTSCSSPPGAALSACMRATCRWRQMVGARGPRNCGAAAPPVTIVSYYTCQRWHCTKPTNCIITIHYARG